jgi:hypothetical protein
MENLPETLQSVVTPDLAQHLAELFGETPDATASGLGATLATLLGALTMRTEHEGIADVMRATHVGLGAGNPLDGLVASLSSPAVRGTLMDHGATIATQLLGAQSAPVTAAIAGQSGLKGETVASLIKLGGPLTMGALARALGGEPTAQGITDLLEAEKPRITAALPPGIRELLAPLAAAATPLHGTPVEAAAEAAMSANRWLPWLIGLVIAIGLFAGLRGCQDTGSEMADRSKHHNPDRDGSSARSDGGRPARWYGAEARIRPCRLRACALPAKRRACAPRVPLRGAHLRQRQQQPR